MLAAAQASRQYQLALDDVRASFNPIFAASRQYEQQLERIAEAERLGAISALEAAGARARAANIIAPAAGGVSASIGLVIGGLLADWLSWRVGFFINLPIGTGLVFAALRVIELMRACA